MNSKWKPVEPWIKRVLAKKGWTPTEWCELAGLTPSTLTRPMNDPRYKMGPSILTLQALASVVDDDPLPVKALMQPSPRPTVRARQTKYAHVFTFEIHIPK